MSYIAIESVGLCTSAGASARQLLDACLSGTSTIKEHTGYLAHQPQSPLPLAKVDDQILPQLDDPCYRSRNNQLAALACDQIAQDVQALVQQFGAHRVAVVIGSSTSGIGETEHAFRSYAETGSWPEDYCYQLHSLASPSDYVAHHLGLQGLSYTVSTACSSATKALQSANLLLRSGLADAAVCGGIDSLCAFTVSGFASLGAISHQRANPFSVHRDGINIGEAAALFVLKRSEELRDGQVYVAGCGSSSDAYHISAPQPDGTGAIAAMKDALADAHLAAEDICYANLHGTATSKNDEMESRATAKVLGTETPCSSTKPITAHTLGAAGAIEAAIVWATLQPDLNPQRQLPLHVYDGNYDPDLPRIALVDSPQQFRESSTVAMISNSFAFGGNNASIILARKGIL